MASTSRALFYQRENLIDITISMITTTIQIRDIFEGCQ